ncbi:MAG: hypothetical protein J0H45_11155, partial [Stenotrophomonas nitritireducens]|nr:hypothetical protein [Stenotrophomonas nitritireducens]
MNPRLLSLLAESAGDYADWPAARAGRKCDVVALLVLADRSCSPSRRGLRWHDLESVPVQRSSLPYRRKASRTSLTSCRSISPVDSITRIREVVPFYGAEVRGGGQLHRLHFAAFNSLTPPLGTMRDFRRPSGQQFAPDDFCACAEGKQLASGD